jgi:hypothetical protein
MNETIRYLVKSFTAEQLKLKLKNTRLNAKNHPVPAGRKANEALARDIETALEVIKIRWD